MLGVDLGNKRENDRDDGDRDVDPEDRAPGPLAEVTAKDGTDRREATGDSEEEGESLAALLEGKRRDHNRQSSRKK